MRIPNWRINIPTKNNAFVIMSRQMMFMNSYCNKLQLVKCIIEMSVYHRKQVFYDTLYNCVSQ